MKYKYYGTAAAEAIPAIWCDCDTCERARKSGGRNIMSRSQQTVDDKILIDFSADTFMHITKGLPIRQIHTCIITHNHYDHFYPEDILMRYGWFAPEIKDKTPLNIYVMKPGAEHLRHILSDEGAVDATPGRVQIHEITPFEPFNAEGYRITPLTANHDQAAGSVIYLIEKDGKCILHAHDTGYFTKDTWEYLKNNVSHLSFVSFDCTETGNYPDKNMMSWHMNYATVKNVRKELENLGFIDENTICAINHFSHNGKYIYDELPRLVGDDGFVIAYDGLEIEF